MEPSVRSVLITGCSSGIGRCCADGLKARGWRVFATARRDSSVAELAAAGHEALQLDLDDSGSIHAAVDEVLSRTGGTLDALFNNGAYGQAGAVEDLSREALRAQFESNLFGWVELTNRVLPVMRAQGHGRIVMNSSILGLVAMPWRGAYNATKFALEGLTDTLRQELAGSGVHVALVEPGPIDSRFRANALAAFERWIDAEASVHRTRYARMRRRLEVEKSTTPFTLPPEAVLKAVVHALESPRPRRRYPVTVPTWLFTALRRLLPAALLDPLLAKAGNS
jgi:NAD(P)-dependent dehydrogenase (short-subunit alcohol dehydrogenase family)